MSTATNDDRAEFDYDWMIVGSGFGGSVSALRLAEKGYRVAVLECGRRFEDEDFAETTWNAAHATSGRRCWACGASSA